MSSTPDISTFTNTTNTDAVFVKISGLFKPTQTGYWTFNLGTAIQSSDDLGILFLGEPGTNPIIPNDDFSGLSTTLSNNTPILFNYYLQGTDSAYTYSTTMNLDKDSYYPILLYFSQNSYSYNFNFSFFYGNYNPVVTQNLKAYFHLNNNSIENISNTPPTSVTGLTYRNYGGRTGIFCNGGYYSDSATANNFIQYVNISTFSLIAANGVSISLWFYATSLDSIKPSIICSITDTISSTWVGGGFLLLFKSNAIIFKYENQQTGDGYSGSCQTVVTITNNTWYHIVVTFDGSIKTGEIYLNNVDLNATQNTPSPNGLVSVLNINEATNLVSIGTSNAISAAAGYTGQSYLNFTGVISQVGIYNRVLSAADVTSLYLYTFSSPSNLITDFSSYIVNPIPDPPNVSSIVLASNNVTITYTNATITGGFDIDAHYAYFSTSPTMDTIAFSIGIGSSGSSTPVDSIQSSTEYYIAIKSKNSAEYISAYSNVSEKLTSSIKPPTITDLSINPSNKMVYLTYTNGSSATNTLYFSTKANMDMTDTTTSFSVNIDTNIPYNQIIDNIVYGSVYYIAIKSGISTAQSEYSPILGPYTMLSMTVPGLQWTSYPVSNTNTNLNPGVIADGFASTFGNTFGNNIVHYFKSPGVPITSGNVFTLQGSSEANPSLTTFNNNQNNIKVGVKFSGFFIPNKTGKWKFNIGTPMDAAILYLGPAGNIITDIIPTTPFLPGFSTALDTSKPFLYKYAKTGDNLIGETKSIGTYDLSQNLSYPMLLYYTQISGYELKLTLTDPANATYLSGNSITTFGNLIYTPLPYAPTLTKVNVIASSKTVEIAYTKSSFNGGYDITKQIAYFSTGLGSTFEVDIGDNIYGNYLVPVNNTFYGNTYDVAVKSINIIGNSVLSNSISTGLIRSVPNPPTLTEVSISTDKTVTIIYKPSNVSTGSDITSISIYFFKEKSAIPDNIIGILTITVYLTTTISYTEDNTYSYVEDNIVYDKDYYVAITSTNAAGESNYSNIEGPRSITNTSALPSINTITPEDKRLTLSFSPPGSITDTITGYQYAIKVGAETVNDMDYRPTTDLDPDIRSYRITTLSDGGTILINGQTYTIYLRVVTTSNSTPVSKTATPYTIPTKPDSVSISQDTTTTIRNTINVTFVLADNGNGGSPYTGYSYSFSGSGYTVVTTNDLNSVASFTFSKAGLFYGQQYYVNITLKNKAGNSDSTTSDSITLSTIPNAPTINSITVGRNSGSIDLLFNQPESNGNAIIYYEYSTNSINETDYISTRSTDTNYSIITTKVNGTLENIINGNSYLVRLRAKNAVGNSLVTTASASVIPYTRPDPPSGVVASVTAKSQNITVVWTNPANNGNAITAYSYSINGNTYTPDQTQTPYGNTFVVTGTFGLPYYATVKVKNAAGYSEPTQSNTVIPYNVPDAPEFTTGVGNKQIILIITKPNTRGSEIEYYKYSIDNENNYRPTGDNTGNISDFTITTLNDNLENLVNGTEYTIYLKAHNLAGDSASTFKKATPQPTPNPPAITTGSSSAGNGFITLVFTAPMRLVNSNNEIDTTIDYYEYSIDSAKTYISTGSKILTYTITGLTNGISYTIALRAHNSIGSGGPDTIVLTPYTIPSAPIINNITLGDQTVTINFTAPNNGGSEILKYYYSIDNGIYTDINKTATSFTINNLINQRTYIIRLKAYNQAGDGPITIANVTPYSASISGTIAASSLTLSGYIDSYLLHSYTTKKIEYYINKINTIDDKYAFDTVVSSAAVSIETNLSDFVSLYASYIIASGVGFTINSDQRIKKNIEYLSSAKSLELVNTLKPCSFEYIDFTKGTISKYGYLAQDVETVFPTIVYMNSEYIPNFYEIVKINVEKIILQTKTTKLLTVGTKLKFYDIQNEAIFREVKEIIDTETFIVTEAFPEETETLFLYGQEVPNFRSIDAKQITAILLSALQEINKIIVDQDKEIDELMQMTEDLRKKMQFL